MFVASKDRKKTRLLQQEIRIKKDLVLHNAHLYSMFPIIYIKCCASSYTIFEIQILCVLYHMPCYKNYVTVINGNI